MKTVKNAIENFITYIDYNLSYSAQTVKAYRTDLMQFNQYLINMGIDDIMVIKKYHISSFIAYLSDENIKRRSIARKVGTLKSFFKYLMKEEIIVFNPMILIKTPTFERKLPSFISDNIMEHIIATFPDKGYINIRDRFIFEMLYATGMRSNELISADLRDMDILKMIITVRKGKGNKQRIIPFNSISLECFKRYMAEREKIRILDDNALLLSVRGKRLSNRDLRSIIGKIVNRAAVSAHMTPHSIRHSFATYMVDHGADIRVVQELLGHSSIATTQIYTHTSISKLKEVYSKAKEREEHR